MSKIKLIPGNLTPKKVATLKKESDTYAPLPDEGVKAEFKYAFGETVEESVEIFGEKAILGFIEFGASHAIAGKCRSAIASHIVKGDTPEEAVFNTQLDIYDPETGKYGFLPGQGATRKSDVEKEYDRLQKIEDDEAKAAKIAELRAMLDRAERGE